MLNGKIVANFWLTWPFNVIRVKIASQSHAIERTAARLVKQIPV